MKTIPYLRIGTNYYKVVQFPTINGQFNEVLLRWDFHTILRDHGRSYMSKIPIYDGSVCFPNHINFTKVFYGFYNTYSELKYKPKSGDITFTMAFFKHIFGQQIEIGLDYFKVLYENPTHPLPVLCLVSAERSTGKTSFLKYLKEVFGNNMTYIDSQNLNSQFNADWGNKLLLGLDEATLHKEELTERIKYLSTTNINKIEYKGKERFESEFYGKFLICSNLEQSFIKIDQEETRFWVLKVPKITNEDVNFLVKLFKEIPAFIDFILNRKYSAERKTRMWFTPEQIYTPALMKLKNNNKNKIENEIANILLVVIEKFDLNQVDFTPLDINSALNRTRSKADLTQIRHILKKVWKIQNQNNTLSYQKFHFSQNGDIELKDAKGRYFTIHKDFLIKNFDELMNDTDD
jgi:hypothetical protein